MKHYKSTYTECDCGCNDPVADNPEEMLRFLANRLEFDGVSESVAATYARDIRYVLEKHYDPVCCNSNCNQGRDCPLRK